MSEKRLEKKITVMPIGSIGSKGTKNSRSRRLRSGNNSQKFVNLQPFDFNHV